MAEFAIFSILGITLLLSALIIVWYFVGIYESRKTESQNMKKHNIKILFASVAIAVSMLMCGCCEKENGIETDASGEFSLVEISVRGERHEYLKYHLYHGRSILHLPNCKYCRPTEESK